MPLRFRRGVVLIWRSPSGKEPHFGGVKPDQRLVITKEGVVRGSNIGRGQTQRVFS